ncbi:phage shock protein PspC (stress-responsive transcriptional regulator) [Pedobacter africanus]
MLKPIVIYTFVKNIELSLIKFTLSYLVYTAILGLVAYFLPLALPGVTLLVSKFWVLFIFLAGITFIAYILADLGMKRNPEAGIMAIMGSIALKMLFSMAFVLIYSQNTKEKGLVLVLNFFSLYLLFSFFEIYSLLRNLRHQNK